MLRLSPFNFSFIIQVLCTLHLLKNYMKICYMTVMKYLKKVFIEIAILPVA